MNRTPQNRITLDTENIVLRRVFAVDSTNQAITSNYIFSVDETSEAKWVNTLENIKTYGIDISQEFHDIDVRFDELSNFIINDLSGQAALLDYVTMPTFNEFSNAVTADISDMNQHIDLSYNQLSTEFTELSNYFEENIINSQVFPIDLSNLEQSLTEDITALSNATYPLIAKTDQQAVTFITFSNYTEAGLLSLSNTKTLCNHFVTVSNQVTSLSGFVVALSNDMRAYSENTRTTLTASQNDLSNYVTDAITDLSNSIQQSTGVTTAQFTNYSNYVNGQFSTVNSSITVLSNNLTLTSNSLNTTNSNLTTLQNKYTITSNALNVTNSNVTTLQTDLVTTSNALQGSINAVAASSGDSMTAYSNAIAITPDTVNNTLTTNRTFIANQARLLSLSAGNMLVSNAINFSNTTNTINQFLGATTDNQLYANTTFIADEIYLRTGPAANRTYSSIVEKLDGLDISFVALQLTPTLTDLGSTFNINAPNFTSTTKSISFNTLVDNFNTVSNTVASLSNAQTMTPEQVSNYASNYISNVIQLEADATNIKSTSKGFYTTQNMTANVVLANSITSSNTIKAATATISGDLSANSIISATSFKAATATITGDLSANSLTSVTSLKAATATITGDLSANSLTSATSLKAATATISGDLSANSLTSVTSLKAATATITGDLSANTITAASGTINGDLGVNTVNIKTAGTTIAPSLRFGNDDTGIFHPGDGALAITANAQTVYSTTASESTISSTLNLTPGISSGPELRFAKYNTNNYMFANSTNAIRVVTNNTNTLTCDSGSVTVHNGLTAASMTMSRAQEYYTYIMSDQLINGADVPVGAGAGTNAYWPNGTFVIELSGVKGTTNDLLLTYGTFQRTQWTCPVSGLWQISMYMPDDSNRADHLVIGNITKHIPICMNTTSTTVYIDANDKLLITGNMGGSYLTKGTATGEKNKVMMVLIMPLTIQSGMPDFTI